MKYTELKESLKSGAADIYLLEGDDAYFRMKGEEQIKRAFLQMPELNFASFDGETLKGSGINELVTAVKNYPFMAEKRIVKVSEFYPTESDYEHYLKGLFEDFPPSSILIIVNSGAKKGVDLKRKKAVSYFDCSRADMETVAKWVYVTVKRAGLKISAAACEDIAGFCLCNMARVSTETEKLIEYKTEGEITQADVDELVYKEADFRLYELTNAAARRDFTKFCVICDELKKKSGDEIYILNGLFNYFKNLCTVISSSAGDKELSALLKMKEYGVKKSREQAYAIGEDRLKFLTEKLYDCISGIKNGVLTPQSALMNAQSAIFFAQGAK